MTAWKAELLFTMQVLNVDEPLQQAEQACPEGAAFMTAAWGHYSHPETQFFISKQEQQPQQTLVPFLIKLPETVSYTEDKGLFWLPGEISPGKQDIARRDYVLNCFQTLRDIRRRSDSCLAATATVDTCRSVARGYPSQQRHSESDHLKGISWLNSVPEDSVNL